MSLNSCLKVSSHPSQPLPLSHSCFASVANPNHSEALDSLRSLLKTSHDGSTNIADKARLQLRITQFTQPPDELELSQTCDHAADLALQNDITGAVKEYQVCVCGANSPPKCVTFTGHRALCDCEVDTIALSTVCVTSWLS